MKCPKCGGFTQYLNSVFLVCRDCGWREIDTFTDKQLRVECKRILDQLDLDQKYNESGFELSDEEMAERTWYRK